MCWVMTSTKFAVVQWESSVGGSPSTATFSTPPFLGVCARASSPVRTTRPATSSSDKLDRNPRLMADLPRDQARAVTMAGRETLVKAGSGSANGVAPATHAGGEGTVVAFLALGVVVGAAYARTADAARCRADRSARARVTGRGPDGGARGRPAHGAYQRAYTSALGAIRQRIEARLLLGPGLAVAGVATASRPSGLSGDTHRRWAARPVPRRTPRAPWRSRSARPTRTRGIQCVSC